LQASQPIAQKLAIRFCKQGRARFCSHHDLMRVLERGVRRCRLPVRMTAGFNPRPRIVFPHALRVGTASVCEEVEIELAARVDLCQARAGLTAALQPVLAVVEAWELPATRAGRRVTSSTYCLAGWPDASAAGAALARLEAAPEIRVVRAGARSEERADVKRWIVEAYQDDRNLIVRLRHGTDGAGCIEDIRGWLENSPAGAGGDLLATRTRMEFNP